MLHAALLALALLAPQPPTAAPRKPAPRATQKVKGVPLIEVPSQVQGGNELAVLLSGDGGWAVTDKGLAERLTKGGIPVVGWNALRYFLRRKKPDQIGHDLERVLRTYLPLWHKEKVILIGYSFGADVMPFMVTRLPPDLADKVSLTVLMSPTGTADFHFHPSEWLRKPADDSQPMLPEAREAPRPEDPLRLWAAGEGQLLPPSQRPRRPADPAGEAHRRQGLRPGRRLDPRAQLGGSGGFPRRRGW